MTVDLVKWCAAAGKCYLLVPIHNKFYYERTAADKWQRDRDMPLLLLLAAAAGCGWVENW